ncbi:glycosyltransferase family 2 protein [Sulfurovum sp.]|uniref:glycosyltransferase family 2 protein n=1 Tax=Sulfurovum sp. TaxID=1969726 RepID=UPI00356A5F11
MENVAVLIPCYNEELTIAKVIDDFKTELPSSTIYVYDNNSTDNTAKIAHEHGATVKRERLQGKGNVIRSMFRDINADVYVMIDGDDTYPAEFVHQLIAPIIKQEADMVIGDRLSNGSYKDENTRHLHNFGNNLVRSLINTLFHADLNDIMTGYRVFSRSYVKNVPINSSGFEIETEMTLHALDKKIPLIEIPINYRDRPEGSFSKLNTFSDGFRVLKTIFWVFKDYRPLTFFSVMAALFFFLALIIGLPVIVEFFRTSFITKVPSAILAVGLMLISIMSLFSAFILDTVVKQHRENFELWLKQ